MLVVVASFPFTHVSDDNPSPISATHYGQANAALRLGQFVAPRRRTYLEHIRPAAEGNADMIGPG